jgi:hypothetical protein
VTAVRQATAHPTAVFHATRLEDGEEALILTTPIDLKENPSMIALAFPWRVEGPGSRPKFEPHVETAFDQWKKGRRQW